MILFTCSSTAYLLTGQYIDSIVSHLRKRNIRVLIHKDAGSTNVTEYIIKHQIMNSMIIFVQYGPVESLPEYNNKNYYLNMNQINNAEYRPFSVFDKISRIKVPIIDYSMKNIEIIREKYPEKTTYFFPYMYNQNDTIFVPTRTYEYDVGIVCSPSPHRIALINKLKQNNINIHVITSKYGLDRDKEICKCKLLLNLHYTKETNILETIRCYPIMFRKILLVSEDSKHSSNIEINNTIIYETYDNLPTRLIEILENYDVYMEKIENFDFLSQFEFFEKYLDEFIMNEYNSLNNHAE